jgi:hypothetical protein
MNPSVHPDVRGALTKEVERRSIKTGKKISLATLKADKFYNRTDRRVRQELGPHRKSFFLILSHTSPLPG